MDKQVAFFLGANTPSGFYSLYDQMLEPEKAQRVFLLKGGAGCGKSSLMRRVAEKLEEAELLEARVVEGPYIHHCVGIHKDVVPVLYEACKYIGVKPDLYDPIEEDVKAYLRGE